MISFCKLRVFASLCLIFLFACNNTPELGDLDLSKMEPQVAEKIRMLHEEAKQSPDSANAWGRLGMTLDVHGIKTKASQCYKKASQLDSKDFRWPYYNAMLLKDSGSEDTLKSFAEAEQRHPNYVPLQIQYGNALQAAGKSEEAARRFENAVRLDASNAHAWLGLAQVAMAKDNIQQAFESAERSAQLNPDFREAHSFLAGLYRKSGDHVKALQAQERARTAPERTPIADPVIAALANEGVSAYWYRARGRAYVEAGYYELALKEFQKAVELQPDAEAYDNLGVALQGVGRWHEAIAHHRKAVSMKPTYLNHLNLGLAYGRTEDFEKAEDAFKKSVELNSDHAESHYNLGITFIKREKWHASLRPLERAVELQPDHADALHALTLAYLATGDEERACDALQRFVRLRPADSRVTKLAANTQDICSVVPSR